MEGTWMGIDWTLANKLCFKAHLPDGQRVPIRHEPHGGRCIRCGRKF